MSSLPSSQKNEETINLAHRLHHTPWCEDYERMISGMLYNPNAPKLAEARHRARNVTEDFNNFSSKNVSYDKMRIARFVLLEKILGNVGKGSSIERPFWPDYGCNIWIGEDTEVNFKYVISIAVCEVFMLMRCSVSPSLTPPS